MPIVTGDPILASDVIAAIAAQSGNPQGAITLNWGGGAIVSTGTYLFVGSAPYAFNILSFDASVGSAGGVVIASVLNQNQPVAGLTNMTIASAGKVRFTAGSSNAAVPANAMVAVAVRVAAGTPTDTFFCLNILSATADASAQAIANALPPQQVDTPDLATQIATMIQSLPQVPGLPGTVWNDGGTIAWVPTP